MIRTLLPIEFALLIGRIIGSGERSSQGAQVIYDLARHRLEE